MSDTQKQHWRNFFKSEHLGAADLDPGEERILTIASAGWGDVPVPGSPKKEKRLVISFAEKGSKPMVVNVTNSRTISAIAGTGVIEGWVGRKIQVYQSSTKFKGEETECLRIRPREPLAAKGELTPQHPKWTGAVKSYAEGSIGLEGIRAHFALSDENAELLKQEAANA